MVRDGVGEGRSSVIELVLDVVIVLLDDWSYNDLLVGTGLGW